MSEGLQFNVSKCLLVIKSEQQNNENLRKENKKLRHELADAHKQVNDLRNKESSLQSVGATQIQSPSVTRKVDDHQQNVIQLPTGSGDASIECYMNDKDVCEIKQEFEQRLKLKDEEIQLLQVPQEHKDLVARISSLKLKLTSSKQLIDILMKLNDNRARRNSAPNSAQISDTQTPEPSSLITTQEQETSPSTLSQPTTATDPMQTPLPTQVQSDIQYADESCPLKLPSENCSTSAVCSLPTLTCLSCRKLKEEISNLVENRSSLETQLTEMHKTQLEMDHELSKKYQELENLGEILEGKDKHMEKLNLRLQRLQQESTSDEGQLYEAQLKTFEDDFNNERKEKNQVITERESYRTETFQLRRQLSVLTEQMRRQQFHEQPSHQAHYNQGRQDSVQSSTSSNGPCSNELDPSSFQHQPSSYEYQPNFASITPTSFSPREISAMPAYNMQTSPLNQVAQAQFPPQRMQSTPLNQVPPTSPPTQLGNRQVDFSQQSTPTAAIPLAAQPKRRIGFPPEANTQVQPPASNHYNNNSLRQSCSISRNQHACLQPAHVCPPTNPRLLSPGNCSHVTNNYNRFASVPPRCPTYSQPRPVSADPSSFQGGQQTTSSTGAVHLSLHHGEQQQQLQLHQNLQQQHRNSPIPAAGQQLPPYTSTGTSPSEGSNQPPSSSCQSQPPS